MFNYFVNYIAENKYAEIKNNKTHQMFTKISTSILFLPQS